MRVVCIEFDDQLPELKKGRIYTVINIKYFDKEITSRLNSEFGNYYQLAECGNSRFYHHSIFVEIEDDQPDEVEKYLERKFRS